MTAGTTQVAYLPAEPCIEQANQFARAAITPSSECNLTDNFDN
jgi:hypothetical protein